MACSFISQIVINSRGGVENTRLEAKGTKKIQGQGQPYRGQSLEAKGKKKSEAKDSPIEDSLSRPRTKMLEDKD